jgi:flagellar basal-body rod protein FlgF
MTALYRQDVWANNLANLDTTAFKPDVPSAYPRPAVRQEDNVSWLPSNAMLERLGAGAMLNPNRISFAQGSLKTTGQSLDIAIQGEGFFIVKDRSTDAQPLRLTRDGRLTRNNRGELVQAASGLPVVDTRNAVITLDPRGEVTIDGDGSIKQNGRVLAQLKLVDVPNKSELRKIGNGLFEASPATIASPRQASGSVRQGTIEDSGVDEVRALLAMTSAAREVDANVDMMKAHDRMSETAIARLGRVG